MKSLDVLSAPLPVAEPGGRGAGDNPQLARLALNASTQYFLPWAWLRPILSAAALKSFETFLSVSSFPPIVNCVLKA